jgi:riboflavin kinase/FMN adenylyltransferase
MQRWRGLDEVPGDWGPSVVTVGFFDGVHHGHRRVVRRAVQLAEERGARAVVLTFDPHPSEVVRPGTHPPLLTTPGFRSDLMASLGVDAVLVLPFTAELSKQTPEEFVRDVLAGRLHAVTVVVGENFHFGHRAAGNVALLTELGGRYGFTVEGLALATPEEGGDESRFSSTDVRRMVLAGDVETAALRLDRPHRVEGPVVHGAKRGRELGFPTANVETPKYTAIPADGVYAGWLVVDGARLPAAISVGTNPQFDGESRTVEAYALDRTDLDLYDRHVAVEFVARVRGQERFPGIDELIERMKQDVAKVRVLLDVR